MLRRNDDLEQQILDSGSAEREILKKIVKQQQLMHQHLQEQHEATQDVQNFVQKSQTVGDILSQIKNELISQNGNQQTLGQSIGSMKQHQKKLEQDLRSVLDIVCKTPGTMNDLYSLVQSNQKQESNTRTTKTTEEQLTELLPKLFSDYSQQLIDILNNQNKQNIENFENTTDKQIQNYTYAIEEKTRKLVNIDAENENAQSQNSNREIQLVVKQVENNVLKAIDTIKSSNSEYMSALGENLNNNFMGFENLIKNTENSVINEIVEMKKNQGTKNNSDDDTIIRAVNNKLENCFNNFARTQAQNQNNLQNVITQMQKQGQNNELISKMKSLFDIFNASKKEILDQISDSHGIINQNVDSLTTKFNHIKQTTLTEINKMMGTNLKDFQKNVNTDTTNNLRNLLKTINQLFKKNFEACVNSINSNTCTQLEGTFDKYEKYCTEMFREINKIQAGREQKSAKDISGLSDSVSNKIEKLLNNKLEEHHENQKKYYSSTTITELNQRVLGSVMQIKNDTISKLKNIENKLQNQHKNVLLLIDQLNVNSRNQTHNNLNNTDNKSTRNDQDNISASLLINYMNENIVQKLHILESINSQFSEQSHMKTYVDEINRTNKNTIFDPLNQYHLRIEKSLNLLAQNHISQNTKDNYIKDILEEIKDKIFSNNNRQNSHFQDQNNNNTHIVQSYNNKALVPLQEDVFNSFLHEFHGYMKNNDTDMKNLDTKLDNYLTPLYEYLQE
eukprot:UN25307